MHATGAHRFEKVYIFFGRVATLPKKKKTFLGTVNAQVATILIKYPKRNIMIYFFKARLFAFSPQPYMPTPLPFDANSARC